MTHLRGQTVRIIVHEPHEWKLGNLFGEIISDRNNTKIIVKLLKPIAGQILNSDLLKLTPKTDKDTFRTLAQLSTTFINGELITKDSEEGELILSGTVTFD